MTPQRHINTGGGQSQMMQMGIASGQSTMNTVMGRPNQMVNQGMGSQVRKIYSLTPIKLS